MLGSGSAPHLAEPDPLQGYGREEEQGTHDVYEESGGIERHLDLLLSAVVTVTLSTVRTATGAAHHAKVEREVESFGLLGRSGHAAMPAEWTRRGRGPPRARRSGS